MKEWRINFVLALILLLSATVVGRLFFLQVLKNDWYSALARGQQKLFMSSLGDRGQIFLTNHSLPVATNHEYPFIYLSPIEVEPEEKEGIAEKLSSVLLLDKSDILDRLQENSLYELLKSKLSQEEYNALKDLNLTGVHFGSEKVREYPYDNFASHLLGFVNQDGEGQYGAEGYLNSTLQGKEGFFEGERSAWGYFFPGFNEGETKGEDITLTVDYNIQYFAEKLLVSAQDSLDIEGGTILVMDPLSGKILALANLPSFNPNLYSEEKDFSIFQTDAIQKVFEPGSVFKPITMAAALDFGKITPQTTYFDQGCIKVSIYDVCNYENRIYAGELTMTNVLEKSINTGAMFAEDLLGHNNFKDYIRKFGIFEKTGVDLDGEVLPLNLEFKKGHEINFVTASFGQGIEMTPMQLARAFSVIANGGKLVTPFVVERNLKISDNNIISGEASSKLTAMLVSVVENGFGKAARVPGYFVAGKTGTAQISYSSLGESKAGYSDKTWQSFIGFAPAFNPRFLILVKLDNPATKTAEYSALPLFQTLAKYIIDYYQIPPDYE
ncbi:MAG: penicillin-binding protein 2 [Candidatus Nealsonbacteria bacterium]